MTADRRFPPPRSIEERPESVFVVPGRDRPRAVSASRSVRLGPLLAVANFRQMQGKFARSLRQPTIAVRLIVSVRGVEAATLASSKPLSLKRHFNL